MTKFNQSSPDSPLHKPSSILNFRRVSGSADQQGANLRVEWQNISNYWRNLILLGKNVGSSLNCFHNRQGCRLIIFNIPRPAQLFGWRCYRRNQPGIFEAKKRDLNDSYRRNVYSSS